MSRDFILSYGSLLSRQSRVDYSAITADVYPALVSGWKRGWCVRHLEELTTHAGAIRDNGSTMHCVLVPTELNDDIREREKYYDFVEVERSDVEFPEGVPDAAAEGKFWICQPKAIQFPDSDFPLSQSYVDTCLIGCIETGISDWPVGFILATAGWEHCWVDDRNYETPIYVRAAVLSAAEQERVDDFLDEAGVLEHRRK
ncbi:MAG: gamma-glutamylcyclotransferase [Planctomycetota bacterium]